MWSGTLAKTRMQNNVKRIEGQNKLTFVSNQDSFGEKVCSDRDEIQSVSHDFPWNKCRVS